LAAHQLTGTALAWWENYCAAAQDASTVTWKKFVDEFHRYHIPAATMKRKADEFRELQQGNKFAEEYTYQFIELARYALEEVDNDEKKQDMFRKGLNAELKKLLSPCIYPDFNTLMNMDIITERPWQRKRETISVSSSKPRLASRIISKSRGTSALQCLGPKPLCSTGPSHKLLALRPPTPSSNSSRARTP
jgi:hypothetical protein